MLEKVSYRLVQCYLEMARAGYTDTECYLPSAKQVPLQRELRLRAQMSFLITSLTIIYSYLAIEAFVNYRLYRLWENSRKKSSKDYSAFYHKYGHINEFTKLKDTELKYLEERIKVLCESYQVPRIDRSNPKLWRDFSDLLEKARHFIIHSFPDPIKFQEFMKMIQENHKLGEWAKIAEEIISHFLMHEKKKLPKWLKQNEFFAIKRIELLR